MIRMTICLVATALCFAQMHLATAQSPPPEPPAAPSAVSATVDGNGEVTVTWDTVANATGYEIGRSEKIGKGNNWSAIEAPIGNVTQPPFTEAPGPGSGTYRYYVSAHNANGESSWSNGGRVKVTDGSESGTSGGSGPCTKNPNHKKCTGS